MYLLLLVISSIFLLACSESGTSPSSVPTSPKVSSWKGIILAGNTDYDDVTGDVLMLYDNSKDSLYKLFTKNNDIPPENIKLLSRNPEFIKSDSVFEATLDGVSTAFSELDIEDGDGCFLFMNGVGYGSTEEVGVDNSNGGMKWENGDLPWQTITPDTIATILDSACGDKPTILIASSCFSGSFLKSAIAKPNRIIITASKYNKGSFECSIGDFYPHWDACLIKALQSEDFNSWQTLYEKTNECVLEKENTLGSIPSESQLFIGDDFSKGYPVFEFSHQ